MTSANSRGRRSPRGLGIALILAVVGTRAAFAQTPTGGDEAPQQLQEVVVTGSRIPVPANIEATSPMLVLTAQDILLSGHSDIVDVINDLPQTVINSSLDYGNHSNPAQNAGGFATADLRGLGPQRTIVLVNGRRLGIGDSNTANSAAAPDLDQIPLAMVERVEIVTGGASATYGSDAIAGVVNFILKDHVQGMQVDAQFSGAQHDQHDRYIQAQEIAAGDTPPTGSTFDGATRDLSILGGTELFGGQGQVTGYFAYHGQSALPGSERDFSACPAVSTNQLDGDPSQPGATCFGTSSSNLFVTNVDGARYGVVGNQFVPWPAPNSVPPSFFNAAAYQYMQRQDTRYQAGLLGHSELTAALRPYFELGFMDDSTLMQIAPSGIFPGENPLTPDGQYLINCSNPLLSAQEASILCTPEQIAADKADPGSASADVDIGRRNIEGGGRSSSFEHRAYRAVAGMDGDFAAGVSYDVYVLYSHTSLFQSNQGYLNYAAIDDALQVTLGPSGNPVCVSGGSCMPYDIFATGAVTPKQLSPLYTNATDSGSNGEQILAANVTGQLGQYGIASPWAREGVGVNTGAEYRVETLSFSPDAAELSGLLAGYGGAAVPIDQRQSVDAGFAEARLPIAQDRPLVKDLTFAAGYRYSHYSTAGAANAYKLDLQYATTAEVRLRATFDHAIRAPNLIEIYTPLSYSLSGTVISDPCAPTNGGTTPAVASLAACEHTGLSATQYGNGLGPAAGGTSTIPQCVASCGAVSGGNPGLMPETADTWSLGLTLTPAPLAGFTATVDYFHILVKNEIATVPGTFSLQQCLNTGNPVSCSQIVRTPEGALSGATVASGGYILENNVNTGAALVSGIDLRVEGRWPLGARWGAVNASLVGTWLQHDAVTPYSGAPSYDCAGLFGATCLGGSVTPSWRHKLRVTWELPSRLQLSAQWRFIGHTSFDNNSSQPQLQGLEEGFYDPYFTHIPDYSYFDLTAIWEPSAHLQIRAGADNVLDKDPPFLPWFDISGAAGTLNTFPTYDVMGRRIFVAVRITF